LDHFSVELGSDERRKFASNSVKIQCIAYRQILHFLDENRIFQQFMAKNYEKDPADFHDSAFPTCKYQTKLFANCQLD
jgi:hypothetical protein